MISSQGFTKISDWLGQSKEKIHKYLLYNALYKCLKEENGLLDIINNADIIEKRNKSYLDPPIYLIFKHTAYPFEEVKFDISKYWDNEFLKDINNYSSINYNNYQNNDDTIVSVNYVNGTAKLRSRLDNVDRVVSFDKINKDSPISLDDMTIRDTFTYKSMNSNY